MIYPLLLKSIEVHNHQIELLVPDENSVKNIYQIQKQKDNSIPFPYWTKLWPSAIAMANFLYENTFLIKNKNVLELAAGLALPSFIATEFAKQVCCSDYLSDAVELMNKNIDYHKTNNINCTIIDWNNIAPNTTADVIIMSDVNYEPDEFDNLYQVMLRFLSNGTIIILATPQRLMAKSFIEKLAPFCICLQEKNIVLNNDPAVISIMVLQKNKESLH